MDIFEAAKEAGPFVLLGLIVLVWWRERSNSTDHALKIKQLEDKAAERDDHKETALVDVLAKFGGIISQFSAGMRETVEAIRLLGQQQQEQYQQAAATMKEVTKGRDIAVAKIGTDLLLVKQGLEGVVPTLQEVHQNIRMLPTTDDLSQKLEETKREITSAIIAELQSKFEQLTLKPEIVETLMEEVKASIALIAQKIDALTPYMAPETVSKPPSESIKPGEA